MAEERRLVTVLFADVVGSTALGESLDPEDLRRLLSRFYAIASDVVSAHGGTLEKFIGDAALAIFGVPQAHDDDARRGLAAALQLRDRMHDDAWLSQHLPIRLGVNTGDVVASRDRARGDFIITGDAVNVAARLQQSAEPWQILTTERTMRAAGGAFSFGEAMALDLRGKTSAVQAYPVLGERAEEAHRIPLFGRAADLTQLELVASRAFSERRPFLVSLIAPAGTGKSRLLEEFLGSLRDTAPDAQIATAQCLPYGQRLTYWPMRQLLFGMLDIADDARPEEVRERVRNWLRESGDANADKTAELLAATIGASEVEVSDRASLFAAWRTLLELAAARQPLLLVVEDLHWSSDSLLDLVEFILQPRGDVPMLMATLTRPELLDRRPGWGGGRGNHVSLMLDPLRAEDVGRLVEHMLDGPSPDIVQLVVERAEGNPFYAGEIVRSILERGTDLSDPGGVADAVRTLPDTVQATVLARLDLLDHEGRRALQVGAVFGRSFSRAGIGALDETLADHADPALEGLIERDLVRPSGGDQFAFRHILIREVAYQTMPRAERAILHAAAGRWLMRLAEGREDELAELIAFHLREAAALSATSGTRDARTEQEAVTWLRRAAETALGASANVEASRHVLAAIELAEADERPELYLLLGQTYASGDRSVDAYTTGLRLAREQGRPPDLLLRYIGNILMVSARWYSSVARQPREVEMQALIDDGLKMLPEVGDARTRATFLISCGFMPFWLSNTGERAAGDDDYRRADERLAAGLALAESLDDAPLISAALDASVSTMARTPPAKAREISRRRTAMGVRLNLQERLDANFMVAWNSALLGDFPAVLAAADEAMGLLQPGQNPAFAFGGTAWRAYALALLGRWDEMAEAIERCRALWIEADRPAAGYALQGLLAGVDVARRRRDDLPYQRWREVADHILGRFDPAHPTAAVRAIVALDAEGISAIVSHPERYGERIHFIELAMSVACDHGIACDEAALDRTIRRAEALGTPVVEAQARRLRGTQRGDTQELEQSLALFGAVEAEPFVARVLAEIGLQTSDDGRLSDGLNRLERLGELEQLEWFRSRMGGS
ncbi:MAG: adenylate/guanylate cyclase domain-containing protein [Chloroflexota bacterium]